MSGNLFDALALPAQHDPSGAVGKLYGPYARQIVSRRIKLWFALVTDIDEVRRYELLFEKGRREGSARFRPYSPEGSPQHGANFEAYRAPTTFDRLPLAPHRQGAKIADTALAMLSGDDLVHVTRLVLTGELPRDPFWTATADEAAARRLALR